MDQIRKTEASSGTGIENRMYSGSCQVVHVDAQSYSSRKQTTCENRIMSSYFRSLEAEIRPKGLALKYAAEGTETYWLQHKCYQVTDGKYLLVNEAIPALDVAIKQEPTWSVCVDIDTRLVNDLLHQLLYPNELDEYEHISRSLLSPELFVREARAGERLQELLRGLIPFPGAKQVEAPALEQIFELTSLLVQEQVPVISSYYKLQTAKLSTRKELFHRLLQGKELLDDSLFSEVNIKQAADAGCLSEFRFYRLFKQCFGLSPYDYLLKNRIEKSVELKKQGYTWAEIAFQLNFTDLPAFSKCFKKIKGVSPKQAFL